MRDGSSSIDDRRRWHTAQLVLLCQVHLAKVPPQPSVGLRAFNRHHPLTISEEICCEKVEFWTFQARPLLFSDDHDFSFIRQHFQGKENPFFHFSTNTIVLSTFIHAREQASSPFFLWVENLRPREVVILQPEFAAREEQ